MSCAWPNPRWMPCVPACPSRTNPNSPAVASASPVLIAVPGVAPKRRTSTTISPNLNATGPSSASSVTVTDNLTAAGLTLLGDASLPLMLFALGVRLTALTRQGMALGLLGALARPIIGLAIGIPLAWALGLEGAARGQLLLFAALPPAVMQFMLAERYHQEPDKVGAMIMLGNALAILFVPLALALGL